MDGPHNKFMSQLVSHGNEQDLLMYPDRFSPAVTLHAVMTCLAFFTCNVNYDIKCRVNCEI